MIAAELGNLLDHVDARQVCRQFGLSEPAQWLLDTDIASSELLRRLMTAEYHADAIRFLAYALPKRHAVWWATICVWQAYRPIPEQPVELALRNTLRWLVEPTEANRRVCEPSSGADAMATAAGCLTYAVYYSDGSMLPHELPPLTLPQTLSHRLVAGCVMLAVAHRWNTGAGPFARLHHEALVWGQCVANGELPLPGNHATGQIGIRLAQAQSSLADGGQV